jgi:5-(carboxyamino)imidazole ribonucleotide mutase
MTTNNPASEKKPLVAVIMGSKSDWDTMQQASKVLTDFGISHDCQVMSAHRTPEFAKSYIESAHSRGIEVIIAGAGGAAHLAGVAASHTVIPVLGVPMESSALNGLDSLLSTVQMPGGIPVGTLAIGKAGAKNAGLLAVAILALSRPELHKKLVEFRKAQTEAILKDKLNG